MKKVIIKQKMATTGARWRLIKKKNLNLEKLVDCQRKVNKGKLIGVTNLGKSCRF